MHVCLYTERLGLEQSAMSRFAQGLHQRLLPLSCCHRGRIKVNLIFGSAIGGTTSEAERYLFQGLSFPAFVEQRRLDQT